MKPSILLVLIVVALIIGGFGLYFGVSTKELATQLDSRTANLEQKVDGVEASVADSGKKLDTLRGQVQNAINTLDGRLTTVEQEVTDLNTKLTQPRQAAKEGGEGKKAEGGGQPEKMAKPADGMYTIAPGDTVGKIAKMFGVTQRAIMEANPTLESNKMKVGRKVRIP